MNLATFKLLPRKFKYLQYVMEFREGLSNTMRIDDAVNQDPDPKLPETEAITAKEKDPEDSNDSELIIDEDQRLNSAISAERGTHPNAEQGGIQSLDTNYAPSGLKSPTDSPVNNSFDGVPSPESIPLPDSTPPPAKLQDDDDDPHSSVIISEDEELEEGENISNAISFNNQASFSQRTQISASRSKEEYDPSQPLTSSDEEEHSTKLISPSRLPNRSVERRIPVSRQTNAQKDDDDSDVDISSIPMPSEDYRRPTIQFSIPTRHKLLSISSLIKRQRGVAKKENRGSLNFASEVSKAFGEDKNDESDEDSLQANEGGARVSLVAEIFGSDDEEENEDKNEEESPSATGIGGNDESSVASNVVPTIVVPFEEAEVEGSGPQVSLPPADVPGWEAVVTEIPEPIPQSHNASIHDEENKEDSDDSIAVVETIQRKKNDADDDIQVLSISKIPTRNRRSSGIAAIKPKPIEKERPSLLESISDGDSEFEHSSPRADAPSDPKRKVRKDKEREKGKEADKKQLKRKRSLTPTLNREEGEIVDSPEKRRKKKKEKKKGKKRRKSKEDKSRFNFVEKKINDSTIVAQNSSEEENKSERVSWKKPSNSTKERNYRDGKPKAEEKYFKTSLKRKDTSPREHSEKNTKEDLHTDKGKLIKDKYDTRRVRRRSASPKSRSRSLSASKHVSRRLNSRSRRSTSTNRSLLSRSRSRSLRRSRKRGRFSISPRRTRSGSRGSPRVRSRSPLKPQRNRRRSSSLNHARRHRGRKRSEESSSSSTSSKRERKRRRDKIPGKDKSKKPKEKEKSKEKVQDLKETKEKDKDREKDKDKKKRRKRREKSVSPAKEIFADGDSIVVSLNFQKSNPSAAVDGTPSRNEPEGEKKKARSRTRHSRPSESTDNGKPRMLKKTLLIDLESSPVQEQNIGVSPTLIVLSDDEDGDPFHKKNSDDSKEHGQSSVTTTTENGQNIDSMSPYRLGVPADSTQLQHSNASDPKLDGSFNASICTSMSPSESSNLSPTRGDSLVTSTRDSENGMHHDDESRSPSRSPSGKSGHDTIHHPHSPAGSPPPVPSGTPPSLHATDSRANENAIGSNATGGSHPSGQSSLILGKPLIGNIPGLFPSSSLSSSNSGSLIVPPPIVIPTPPAPQVRFQSSVNQNLFTTNVLASMASALYAPILAARQQQQTIGTGKYSSTMGSTNSSTTKTIGASNTVLLPKTQISHGSATRSKSGNTSQSAGEGDSPFSPNSSDGDDLFEPPLDRSQSDTATPSKADKTNSSQTSNPTPNNSSTSNTSGNTTKPREKSGLFDSLFGSAPKKNSHQKSHKSSKGKGSGHHKSKSKKTKKEIVKLTEGELRLTEDVPNSAVELRVKEKFLMKLNRQDRVVEEVKLSLKPHYSKKHVTKDEYKEILRRAVPKICHNKSGEINPFKIKELVEAYVKKFRHSRKKE